MNIDMDLFKKKKLPYVCNIISLIVLNLSSSDHGTGVNNGKVRKCILHLHKVRKCCQL